MSAPTDAPRRSSRRPKPKNFSDYSVGDVVLITRHSVDARGRLAYKLSEGSTPNPRWLVTFDGQAWKDEELYERSFGKIVEKADDSDTVSKGSQTRRVARSRGSSSSSSNNKKNNSSKNSGPSSGEDDDQSVPKKKAVAFSENSVAGSDGSSSPQTTGNGDRRSKVSAREQRSRRRQAKIHEEVVDQTYVPGDKRGGSASSSNGRNGPNKKAKKHEEVLKIPMLTGTLYLYRGLNRRAEFIRRY